MADVTMLLAVGSPFVAAAIAAIGICWNLRGWIDDKFATLGETLRQEMKLHEEMDNTRHVQNLAKFSAIHVTLASKGIRIIRTNGDGDEKQAGR